MLCYTRKEPVGVCGQIVPWNFPLLMACWKVAPALAAGCTIVLKPAEQTPLTALRLGELALEAGIPARRPERDHRRRRDGRGAGGPPRRRQDRLHRLDRGRAARSARKAGEALKRVTLELGGKSPNIILPDADLEAAVKGSYQAIYFNSGQACNAGSRLFVPDGELRRGGGRRWPSAPPARRAWARASIPPRQLGPLVSAEQLERVIGYIESGRAEGAELVTGGGPPDGDSGGYFVAPTLFTATTDDLAIAREEIFGPVLVALPYESLEEVAERANDSEYGLAAGVWTRDALHRPPARGDAAGGLGVREPVGHGGPRRALRRLQGLGRRPRARPRGARRLPRGQDRVGRRRSGFAPSARAGSANGGHRGWARMGHGLVRVQFKPRIRCITAHACSATP